MQRLGLEKEKVKANSDNEIVIFRKAISCSLDVSS